MSLTIEKIAEIAGVSRSTVSRVINGDKYVKETTREAVQSVINSLEFQPNIAARSLAEGKTRIIGLVIPAGVATLFADPYFPQLIQGISAACNANDYSLMLWMNEPAYERRTIRQILYGGLLDGVIVSSMLIEDPIVKSLYESKKPFIQIGRHPFLNVNYLDVDNISGGSAATSYLIECGCKRIAIITGPKNMIAGIDRYTGYRNALSAHGHELIDDLIVEGDFTEASGYQAMKKLLPKKPDGLFVASDTMAIGALRALREMNVHVPDDIALVGFDDSPAAPLSDPPLTTMRQDTYMMGYRTSEILQEIIVHPGQEPRHVVINTELVVRGTCHHNQNRMKEVNIHK